MKWTAEYGLQRQNPLGLPLTGILQARVVLDSSGRPTVESNVSFLSRLGSPCLPCSTALVLVQDQLTAVHLMALVANLANRLPLRTHSLSTHRMHACVKVKKGAITKGIFRAHPSREYALTYEGPT
jgi:hypothetical protein